MGGEARAAEALPERSKFLSKLLAQLRADLRRRLLAELREVSRHLRLAPAPDSPPGRARRALARAGPALAVVETLPDVVAALGPEGRQALRRARVLCEAPTTEAKGLAPYYLACAADFATQALAGPWEIELE